MFFMSTAHTQNHFAILKTHVCTCVYTHIHIHTQLSYQMGMSENGLHPKMALQIRENDDHPLGLRGTLF